MNGTTLTLTFSETLGAASSLANSAFTVKKTPQDGDEQTVSLSGTPAISGDTVTLTLANAVLATEIGVKVSYAKPASGTNNKLVDADGAEVADFTDEWVVNVMDVTRPRLVRGEIESGEGHAVDLTLYFSELMDEDSWGAADFYRLDLQSTWRSGQSTWRSGWSYTISPNQVTISGNKVVGPLYDTGLRPTTRTGPGGRGNLQNGQKLSSWRQAAGRFRQCGKYALPRWGELLGNTTHTLGQSHQVTRAAMSATTDCCANLSVR